jgi:transketolase
LIANAARHQGPVYIRTTRPKLPVLYQNSEPFPIGGLKVLRHSEGDQATVIGAGVTLY